MEIRPGSVLFVSSSQYLSYAMRTVTFLVVDDTASYRHILRQLVQSQPGWSVMAEADDGLKAIHLAAMLVPDVMLMDVSMPIMSGIEATQRTKQTLPGIRVIVFSGHHDGNSAARACWRGRIIISLKRT